MGKDRRKEKDETDEALGKEKDKFGKSTVAMPSENKNSRASSHFLPSKSCGSGNSTLRLTLLLLLLLRLLSSLPSRGQWQDC
jgi:hypothetical protein